MSLVQRKWSYLEPLFIGSEEVRKELPVEAQRFEGTDAGVKAVLRAANDARNVLAACNAPGLFKDLEVLQTQLDQCEKALAEFLDGKRRQFPRFYFVSKSDLLDMLSNGSTPRRILKHIPKVFLSTDTLLLSGKDDDGARPIASRWVSGVGVEAVDFTPPTRIDGKVEHYLLTILDAQRYSLKQWRVHLLGWRLITAGHWHTDLACSLTFSLLRYDTQPRCDWLMDKQVDGRGTDPAQITLLVCG